MKFFTFITFLFFTTINVFSQDHTPIPYKQGDKRLVLKLPHINYLSLQPLGKHKDNKTGFNGYGLGYEYNYKDHKFIEASLSFISTFELPFPAPLDKVSDDYIKYLYSYYVSVTDNFVWNRITLGYGVNFASNDRKLVLNPIHDESSKPYHRITHTNKSFGLTFNSFYRIGKSFNMGVIYRPSLLKVNQNTEFVTEHLISIELNWKIQLNKNNSSKK